MRIIKNVLTISILINGMLPCWAGLDNKTHDIKDMLEDIKNQAQSQYLYFDKKNSLERVRYLEKNQFHWLSDIEQLEVMHNSNKEISDDQNLKFKKLKLNILANIYFFNIILKQSSNSQVLLITAKMVKKFVQNQLVKSYILDHLDIFNIHDSLLNVESVQSIGIDVIGILLISDKKNVQIIKEIMYQLLEFDSRDFKKRWIYQLIRQELNTIELLSPILIRLYPALNSNRYEKRFRAIVAIREILLGYPHLQQYVDDKHESIIRILDKLALMVSPEEETYFDARKQIIFILGQLRINYLPIILALMDISKHGTHRGIRIMAIKSLMSLPIAGMPVLKELSVILSNDDMHIMQVVTLELFATKLPVDDITYKFIEKALNDKNMLKYGSINSVKILLDNDQVPDKYKYLWITKLKEIKPSLDSSRYKETFLIQDIDNILNQFKNKNPYLVGDVKDSFATEVNRSVKSNGSTIKMNVGGKIKRCVQFFNKIFK